MQGTQTVDLSFDHSPRAHDFGAVCADIFVNVFGGLGVHASMPLSFPKNPGTHGKQKDLGIGLPDAP